MVVTRQENRVFEFTAPSSLLAKFSAQNPENRAAVHSMGFYEREIGSYLEFASDCPVRTPRCCSVAITPMPLKRRVPPASSESDQLVADGLVLFVPPSSARKS